MTTRSPSSDQAPDDTMIRNRPPRPASKRRLKKRRTGVIIGVIALLALVVLVALYFIGYAMAGDKLPRNATISGVSVGSLDPAAAVDRLQAELGPSADRPIELAVSGATYQVQPADAGLAIDYQASVAKAGGGKSFDPRQIWRVLTGGTVTAPVVTADDVKLEQAVAALAGKTDKQPSDATVAYADAKVKVTPAVTGVTIDREEAAKIIKSAFLVATQPVNVAAQTAKPKITTEQAQQFADQTASPAVSAPITVTAGRAGQFDLTPSMIAKALSFPVENGALTAKLDADRLRQAAADVVSEVELTKPKNATVRIVDGQPKIIPAVNGTTVSAANLAAAVQPALAATGSGRTVSVQLTGANASFGTEDAEKLGVKQVIGKFTTYFPYAEYRNVNIGRAAELINNTLLKPGDTFSLNGIVGERTKANGFTEGYIIQGGRFKKELGGGVSQSATTTYNAMFFAGLKDIQHQPHTLYIDRYPYGREATVAWPSLDLKFQNDTEYGVVVQAFVKKSTPSSRGSITVRMWSTKTYDKIDSSSLRRSQFTTGQDIRDSKPDCEPTAPVQGFLVNYDRLFYNDGKLVKSQPFSWRYAPTNRVICTGN